MRIAVFSWETLHSQAVGGVAAHVTELAAALQRRGHEVHVFTRPGYGNGGVWPRDGVWYHYCPHNLNGDFIEEVQEMCRSFVWHFFQTEDHIGHIDVVHAHDWLASNAVVWIKQGRRDHKAVLTMHSTEYGRCGNSFWGGVSARIRDHERHGTYCADRVVAVSGALTDLYKACDAVCLPSRNEAFGISALEGWAASKPVVAAQNGGPGEFIWQNVTGLKTYATPESVGWGLGTLFTNFEWARWPGNNGRRAAEIMFNWDSIAEKTEQCYRS